MGMILIEIDETRVKHWGALAIGNLDQTGKDRRMDIQGYGWILDLENAVERGPVLTVSIDESAEERIRVIASPLPPYAAALELVRVFEGSKIAKNCITVELEDFESWLNERMKDADIKKPLGAGVDVALQPGVPELRPDGAPGEGFGF